MSKKTLSSFVHLLLNHVDAWMIALIVSALAMFLHGALAWQTAPLLVAVGVGYWFAFALNDYYDAPLDVLDPNKASKNFFVQHTFTSWQKTSLVLSMLLLLSLLFSPFGWNGFLMMGLCLLVSWGYSAPPLYFKGRPGLDLLVHALFVETFPYVMTLVLIEATWTRLDWMLLLILFLSSLTAQLEQQVRDHDTDRLHLQTFTTTMGAQRVYSWLVVLSILMGVTAVIGLLTQIIPLYFLPYMIIATPAIVRRFWPEKVQFRPQKLVYLLPLTGLLYTMGLFAYFSVMAHG